MADLVTPPYGFFAPGTSLFSNPQGSAPIIGPRRRVAGFQVFGVAGGIPPVVSTVLLQLDPNPVTGRGYLIEYGSVQITGTNQGSVNCQLVSAAMNINLQGADYTFAIGFPTNTSLELAPQVQLNLLNANNGILVLYDDLVALTLQSFGGVNYTPPSPVLLEGYVAVSNSNPDITSTFQFNTSALFRIIDGIYG